MGKVLLLDCTLRDGGYINNWEFGEDTIKGFCKKISKTGIEALEVGFIKGDTVDRNKSVFPDINSITPMIQPKSSNLLYVGMLDMSAPIPIDRLTPNDGNSIDGIRVIFKKDKIDQAYKYCERIKELGYKVFVNFVGTDLYTDDEFIAGIKKFNKLDPYAMTIVDTFGLIKRKHFLRLAFLADNNMSKGIVLCYHAHNNLQQAFGNAEALVELNLKRDICIDACVFGMGRGAGNLNLELFAEYMNENYDTQYRIGPMLEIMDEYLNDIYKNKFWGYSLPLYLSATEHCHPNYAVYLAEKDTLTVKAFNEILRGIPDADKSVFSKEKAEKYYRQYQEFFIDDKETIKALGNELLGKNILVIAPGRSIIDNNELVENLANSNNTVVIALNFDGGNIRTDYVFSSNMRRYIKIDGKTKAKCITTSNMKDCKHTDFVVNYSSYSSKNPEIIDNSGLMILKLIAAIGVKEVSVAGMDGYSTEFKNNYYNKQLEYDFSKEADIRNSLISDEIKEIRKTMKINFVTPTQYE